MTTAHRPTFHAAIGGKEQGGGRYIAGVTRVHVHDLAGQMTLKKRAPGQGTRDELRAKDMRAELEKRELEHLKAIGKAPTAKPLLLPPPEDDDEEDEGGGLIIDPEDADDRQPQPPSLAAAGESEDDEDEDDDEDETEELMRELERIKKERATEAARQEREAVETEAREADSAILQGNPLLDPTRLGASAGGASFSVKRRWDDDVVFKNQAREPKTEARRFINDTVRNDFHRKFLQRYVK